MTMTKAIAALILLLALGLADDTRQATQAISQEPRTETPKPSSDKGAPTDLHGDPLPSGAIARLGTVRFRHGGFLADALLSPDGLTLYSAGDRSIEWWDARSGRRKRRIMLSDSYYYVAGIDLSPDGKLLALSSQFRNNVRFWDTASGAEVYPFGDDPRKSAGRSSRPTASCWSISTSAISRRSVFGTFAKGKR